MSFDSGGGGGGNSTAWYSTSIDDMWAWVSRDLSAHYDQANSWKKASELYGLYQYRLQAFRDKLAQAWNPQTSKAAEVYLSKLDELILAVKNVDDIAGRNYQSAIDIPNAIWEARINLKPIYDAYKAAERQYSASTTTTTITTTTPTPSPSPRPAPTATGAATPATTMHDKHLAAQVVMYKLSGSLSHAQSGLGRPAPYGPPVARDDGGSYDGGIAAPVIPPVVPMTPPSPPAGGPTSPMPTPKAPDLSGLHPLPPGQPGPGGPFTPASPGGPTPGGLPPGGVITPGGTGVVRPAGGPRPGTGVIGGILGGAPGRGATPGGLIGGGAARSAGARPNPVGGVIGGAAGPRSTTSKVPGGAMGISGRPSQRADETGEAFDPDTQWDVAQGVTPVLDSPEAQRPIDPGPAIGLSR